MQLRSVNTELEVQRYSGIAITSHHVLHTESEQSVPYDLRLLELH